VIKAPPCLHCDRETKLVTGDKVYPLRTDLRSKFFWVCKPCVAFCGCHPGSTRSLGFPANKRTRQARSKLHELKLDPLWKQHPKSKRKTARDDVYRFMSEAMGLSRDNTHTGMFTLEQCREAWTVLNNFEFKE
jgi:uncharacterized protein YecE (DUF72 family)